MSLSDEILPPAPQGSDPPKKTRQRKPYKDEQLEEGYGVNGRGEDRYKIRYQRPEVAEHVARVLIDNNMDWDATTTKMLQSAAKTNDWPDPTDEAIVRHSLLLRKAPQIQRALQKRLKTIGIDDEAQRLWYSLAWNAALDKKNDTRWVAGMKMLGAAMQIDKKVDFDKKPQPLTLLGAGPLLARMGIPVNDNIDLEVDDAGSNERSEPEETEGDSLEATEPTEADGTEQ